MRRFLQLHSPYTYLHTSAFYKGTFVPNFIMSRRIWPYLRYRNNIHDQIVSCIARYLYINVFPLHTERHILKDDHKAIFLLILYI